MTQQVEDKIQNYKEQIKFLDSENRLIFKRIERLKRKINRRNMKKKKIKNGSVVRKEGGGQQNANN